MSDARLKSFFDRLNKLMSERDDLGADITEVKREAAGAGYDPAVLMRVIAEDRRRAKNPEAYAEREELTDLYVSAIKGGGMPGRSARIEAAEFMFNTEKKSVREVAKLMGISPSEAGRLRQLVVARPKVSPSQARDRDSAPAAEPHDPETGEVLSDEPAPVEGPAPVEVVIPPASPAPAPVMGKDWPDMPPFLARQGALQ